MNWLLILVNFLSFILCLPVQCQDIIGCGGFVKSEVKNFVYHKLSVQLTYADGTLNYVTDVLPNGAFSVPIYDNGIYFLKVVGPKGWSFDPTNGYQLNIDGQQNLCSVDYKFQFTGFSIFGKIATANIDHGPSGIIVTLVQNQKEIQITTTIEGGDFIFSNVFPGNYSLHLKSEINSGKEVDLLDTIYDLTVTNDNIHIKDSFIIRGYPVFGDVKFQQDPAENVDIYLFAKDIKKEKFDFDKYKCLQSDYPSVIVDNYNYICKTFTNANGEFMFPLLPGGNYIIVPVHSSNSTTFDIEPAKHEFEISSTSIDLRSIFSVTGFSVNGRVLAPISNESIANAEIYVNGNLLTKTSNDGMFYIRGVKKGNHEFLIVSDGYIFNTLAIKFDPIFPDLGLFFPEKVGVCGTVMIDSAQSNIKLFNDEIVGLLMSISDVVNSSEINLTSVKLAKKPKSEDNLPIMGHFCFFTRPGIYLIKPVMDSSFGSFSLAPSKMQVNVSSKPVNLKFSQFRGSISGVIKCVHQCKTGEFEVTLKPSDESNTGSLLLMTQHISINSEVSDKGYFLFKNVVPGHYQIELISSNSNVVPLANDRWCWNRMLVTTTMIDEDIDMGLVFEQIGFSLPISSTHPVNVQYFFVGGVGDQSKTFIDSIRIPNGLSKVCLPNSGKYELKPETCHQLDKEIQVIDTNELCVGQFDLNNLDCHLKIVVKRFKVKVDLEFVSVNAVSDLQKSEIKGLLHKTKDESEKENSMEIDVEWSSDLKGFFYFWVLPNGPVEISLKSLVYLFKPDKLAFHLTMDTDDCVSYAGSFVLEEGTFIDGNISPPVDNVTVEVHRKSNYDDELDIIVATTSSDSVGKFQLGPLNSSFAYELVLMKSGFKFVKANNTNDYIAYKLAELNVEVVDSISGKPISGILLSMIGDDFRRNGLTDDEGKFVFSSLLSGTYYLRAMMKELEFFPSGAIEVSIIEGMLEVITIQAIRTSFSVHGKVVSLSGEPEIGIVVEADPLRWNYSENSANTACKVDLLRNEHAISDDNGQFRIRGLLPGCHYNLSIKVVSKHDDNGIVRSFPPNNIIKMVDNDVHHVKIYAIRNFHFRELTATVWSNDDVHLNSLQCSVFPIDNPDNVIAVHKFSVSNLYFQISLPKPIKKTVFVIRLQSNLSPLIYKNITDQERIIVLEPNESKSFYQHFDFHFHPIKKNVMETDLSMTITSSILLPCIILSIIFLFYKKEYLEPILLKIFKVVGCRLKNFITYSSKTFSSSSTRVNVLDASDISELNSVIAKPKPSSANTTTKKSSFWLKSRKT